MQSLAAVMIFSRQNKFLPRFYSFICFYKNMILHKYPQPTHRRVNSTERYTKASRFAFSEVNYSLGERDLL